MRALQPLQFHANYYIIVMYRGKVRVYAFTLCFSRCEIFFKDSA